MNDIKKRVAKAVKHFWAVRQKQAVNQGKNTGQRDAGLRTAVTGGKHLDGFISLCRELIVEAGLPEADVFWRSRLELPGYYRAEKSWDLLAVVDGQLLAVVEFKAQVGPSFGNNFNNRTEEALGNATDLWAAYREGAFKPSQRPWLGYLFLLEECPKSLTPVQVKQPHFGVFEEFHGVSYAKRYEILLTKLLRERLYDGTCLLLSTARGGLSGRFREPSEELSFSKFSASLIAHAMAFAQSRKE
ncbi:MAG: restriction endonuclease [Pirellulales bacterium]|nr:restriction endonuclease [Pirellulales bacterium]